MIVDLPRLPVVDDFGFPSSSSSSISGSSGCNQVDKSLQIFLKQQTGEVQIKFCCFNCVRVCLGNTIKTLKTIYFIIEAHITSTVSEIKQL